MSFDISVVVKCYNCGSDLETTDSIYGGNINVAVNPCETCIENAKDDLNETIDNLRDEIEELKEEMEG